MARLPRLCPAGLPQHIIQRGNNRSVCFTQTNDLSAFSNWLQEYAEKFSVAIHSWVFMTNHIHLLATPETDDGISSMMQSLGRRYVQYFNYAYQRSGTLWEGRFKSCPVQSEHYLLACYRYIEMNPVRAGVVSDPSDFIWSSYRCNGLGKKSPLCTPHSEYIQLGATTEKRLSAYRLMFATQVDRDLLKDVRDSVNKGLALGNEGFKKKIEQLYGRRVRPSKIGRPRIATKTCI